MAGIALRAVTYNVHGQRDDRAALAAVVRDLRADVVIVQEGHRWPFRWRHRCAALADSAGLVYGAGGQPALGNVILTSLRVRVHDTWAMRFPLTPGRHLRAAAFAVCSVGGRRFLLSGSHLSTDAAERPAQAAHWQAALAAAHEPVIAGADLNEDPGGDTWRTVGDGLQDAAAGHDGADRPTFPASAPHRRLDALFVSPEIEVRRCVVVDTPDARRASDHLPVVADLLLPEP